MITRRKECAITDTQKISDIMKYCNVCSAAFLYIVPVNYRLQYNQLPFLLYFYELDNANEDRIVLMKSSCGFSNEWCSSIDTM